MNTMNESTAGITEAYHYPHLGYSFIVTEAVEWTVSFEVYSLNAIDPEHPRWEGFDDHGCNFFTASMEEATPLLKGFIRFDGCSNWERDDTHYCECKEATNLGLLFREMYDLAGRAMGVELE